MAEAGWYDDPSVPGQMRYFDGTVWTDHVHHPELTPPPPPPPTGQPHGAAPASAPLEVLSVKGVNGTIDFDGQAVTIRRVGAMARMTVGKGDKRIPLRSITAVQWKPAGMVRGFIQFTVPGGNEVRSKFGSQSVDAAKDENAVLFGKTQQAEFERLRQAIESRLV